MQKLALDRFSEDLFYYLTGKPKTTRSLLIKKHSENISQHGDFSFPNNIRSWNEYISKSELIANEDVTLMTYIKKDISEIIPESKKWTLEVAKVKEVKGRIHLYLNRLQSIRVGLTEALAYNSELLNALQQDKSKVSLDLQVEDSITSLRLKYLTDSIKNLYCIHLSRKREIEPDVIVTSKSSFRPEKGHAVLCGAVLNSRTGSKENNLKADDYIRIRHSEMTLIAQHKYGVRVSTDSKWKEFIAHIGESAVVFELLQCKPSSAVKVNFECSANGCSKGASFVLYNCARLESIIRGFNDKVDEGLYPPLPLFEETDFNLLTQEDEWCLVFNYIMGFPSLLNSCVEINDKLCEFRPHQICGFLCSMARVVSQYYRKTRILTEPRKHLLPVLYARLHMLKILNDTLKICLNILNIKSVSQMYFYFYWIHLIFSRIGNRQIGNRATFFLFGGVFPLECLLERAECELQINLVTLAADCWQNSGVQKYCVIGNIDVSPIDVECNIASALQ